MDLRLKNFATAVKTFHSLSGGDPATPVVLTMQLPDLASQYSVIGSYGEPDMLGFPINTLWVVLDLSSPYYLKVLKLKGFDSPESYSPPEFDLVMGQGFNHAWVVSTSKAYSLEEPTLYMSSGAIGPAGPIGPEGPPGPAGGKGPDGPPGVINYDAILLEVKTRLCDLYGLCVAPPVAPPVSPPQPSGPTLMETASFTDVKSWGINHELIDHTGPGTYNITKTFTSATSEPYGYIISSIDFTGVASAVTPYGTAGAQMAVQIMYGASDLGSFQLGSGSYYLGDNVPFAGVLNVADTLVTSGGEFSFRFYEIFGDVAVYDDKSSSEDAVWNSIEFKLNGTPSPVAPDPYGG